MIPIDLHIYIQATWVTWAFSQISAGLQPGNSHCRKSFLRFCTYCHRCRTFYIYVYCAQWQLLETYIMKHLNTVCTLVYDQIPAELKDWNRSLFKHQKEKNVEKNTSLFHTITKKVHHVLFIGNVCMVIQLCS